MGWLERRDARNQAWLENANDAHAADPDGDRTPGPPWAHALGALPFLHVIGDIAIAVTRGGDASGDSAQVPPSRTAD